MLDTANVKASIDAWYIIMIVCGTLILLALIDGLYLLSINRRLRETVRISERASQAKTQFLSAMSHDIRTPLNAVLGMMTIAEKKSDDPNAVIQCMEKGMHSGKQLLTLINDILDISKIESGKFTLIPGCVSLAGLMQNLKEMVRLSIEQKQICLECDFDDLPYKWVYGDERHLNQIYLNLLTNAVKYTDKGGKILLRLQEKRITGLIFAAALAMFGCSKKENASFVPKLDTDKNVYLNVAGFFGNFEALDQVTADFNQYYPNVEFSYEQVSGDTFESYLEANPKVDIMMTSEEMFARMGDQLEDCCADLTKEGIDLSAIEQDMLLRENHKGKQSYIPMGQNIYGMVVNTSFLKKEGLEIPENYEAFIKTLTALKERSCLGGMNVPVSTEQGNL